MNEGVAVALQRDGLFVDNDRLAAVIDGGLERSAIEAHLVVPLAERARILAPGLNERAEERGLVWDGHANLYLDPDTTRGRARPRPGNGGDHGDAQGGVHRRASASGGSSKPLHE